MTPIEEKFWEAANKIIIDMIALPVEGMTTEAVCNRLDATPFVGRIIVPQVIWEAYRVDFMIVTQPYKWHRCYPIVIECDGHDWHEKTKDQAKRDRRRDRRLQEMGVPFFRFTGSELWQSPEECVQQIDDYLYRFDTGLPMPPLDPTRCIWPLREDAP